jgi:hypothetical protein
MLFIGYFKVSNSYTLRPAQVFPEKYVTFPWPIQFIVQMWIGFESSRPDFLTYNRSPNGSLHSKIFRMQVMGDQFFPNCRR